MKRSLLVIFTVMVILLFPFTVDAAAGDVTINQSKTYILTADLTVEGNLYVKSEIDFNGYSVYVKGNVYASDDIWVTDGNLTVDGSLIQSSGVTFYKDGEVNVHGDVRMYATDSAGKPIKSDVLLASSVIGEGVAIVEGDIIIHSTLTNRFMGNIEAKGDVIMQMPDSETFYTINFLTISGTEKQTIELSSTIAPYQWSILNPKLEIGGYMNGMVEGDVTQMTLKDGRLKTRSLILLPGSEWIVSGDVHAEGSVDLCEDSSLIVAGEYVQEKGCLEIDYNAQFRVNDDLRLQSVNEKGEYGVGSGYMNFNNTYNDITIGKDLIINTTAENSINSADLIVGGDILQMSADKFTPNKVVLTPKDKHKISLNANSLIQTLELTDDRANCTFSPAKCWNKIIQLDGLIQFPEGHKLFEDGYWLKDAYQYFDYDGGKFLIAHGMVATHINGLAKDPKTANDWYYLANGQAQTQYTGFASYDGEWFYVTNGKLDTGINGYLKYNGGLFYIGAGRVMSEVNGLAKDPKTGKWYYVAGGQVQTQHTGLASYDGEWFYIEEGMLAEDFSGKVKYDGKYFNVVNGMVKG